MGSDSTELKGSGDAQRSNPQRKEKLYLRPNEVDQLTARVPKYLMNELRFAQVQRRNARQQPYVQEKMIAEALDFWLTTRPNHRGAKVPSDSFDDVEKVSTRLPSKLLRQLRIVVANRKAHRLEPLRQQAVVAEAIQHWLDVNTASGQPQKGADAEM